MVEGRPAEAVKRGEPGRVSALRSRLEKDLSCVEGEAEGELRDAGARACEDRERRRYERGRVGERRRISSRHGGRLMVD